MLAGPRASLIVAIGLAVPFALFLAVEHRIAGAWGLPLDDAWIHLQFARNVAEGRGFSYNAGVPVAGSTAPLWTLLLSAAVVLAGPSPGVVKAVGVATTVAAVLVTRAAALAWGASPPAATAAALALAWTGPIAWGALSGMEVPLAAFLVAAALWADGRDRPWLAAGFAGLAPLARPEALILVPLLALARRPLPRRLAAFALLAALALAPAVAFSLATVGAPVPATALAKVEGGVLGWLTGEPEPPGETLARAGAFLADWAAWFWQAHAGLLLALAPAIALVWHRRGPALGLPALALAGHPLAMALLAPYRGPGFQEGRYSAHLLPLAFIVLAVALGGSWSRLRGLVTVGWLALALLALVPAASRHGRAVHDINAMHVHLGRWVAEHLPGEAHLALNDVGAITFLSRRHVLDLMGLVTPDILPYRRQGEGGVIRYVIERCPDYLIVFPAWFPALTARRDLVEAVHAVRLPHTDVAGAREMVVYRFRGCGV